MLWKHAADVMWIIQLIAGSPERELHSPAAPVWYKCPTINNILCIYHYLYHSSLISVASRCISSPQRPLCSCISLDEACSNPALLACKEYITWQFGITGLLWSVSIYLPPGHNSAQVIMQLFSVLCVLGLYIKRWSIVGRYLDHVLYSFKVALWQK